MITNASHVGSNFRSHRSVWFYAGPGSARPLWVTCCRLDAFLLSWLILTFCLSLKCWTGKGKHECRIKLVMVWKLRTVMRYCLCLQSIGCHSRGEVARDVHSFKEHPSQTSRGDAETGKNVNVIKNSGRICLWAASGHHGGWQVIRSPRIQLKGCN